MMKEATKILNIVQCQKLGTLSCSTVPRLIYLSACFFVRLACINYKLREAKASSSCCFHPHPIRLAFFIIIFSVAFRFLPRLVASMLYYHYLMALRSPLLFHESLAFAKAVRGTS